MAEYLLYCRYNKERNRVTKLIKYLPKKAQYWVGYAVGTVERFKKLALAP